MLSTLTEEEKPFTGENHFLKIFIITKRKLSLK